MHKENRTKRNIINVLRWIGVLPAVMAGYIFGPIIINVLSDLVRWLNGTSDNSGWAFIIYYIIAPAFGSALAVYLGLIVAPKAKKIVALVLGALMVILITIGTLVVLQLNKPGLSGAWIITSGIASIVAAGIVIYDQMNNKEDN